MVLRRSATMQMMLDEWAAGAYSNVTEVKGQGILHDQDYLNWVGVNLLFEAPVKSVQT